MLAAAKRRSFWKWFEIKWLPGLGSNRSQRFDLNRLTAFQ